MTHAELLAKLEARNALIVHFSAHAVMRTGLDFPTDLQQVLAEHKPWPLSCSVLTPGHQMDVTGSVGVVLEPRSTANVLRVHHGDAGAYDYDNANRSARRCRMRPSTNRSTGSCRVHTMNGGCLARSRSAYSCSTRR